MGVFDSRQFLPAALMAAITDLRISDPDRALVVAGRRRRRAELTVDGRLNILAADHPARRVTKVGANPLAMADRHDYLARILRTLMCDAVDGVMATMDILQELLLIADYVGERGGPALLDNKLLIVSLNRGGLANTVWEMDDPITTAAPSVFTPWRLDGFKLLVRFRDDDAASLKTILAAAGAISEANAMKLPTFLEPLAVAPTAGGLQVVKTAEALAPIAGVASALGESSRYLWLKLPYCQAYDVVARATTLPILVLGGEAAGDAAPFLHELAGALAAGPNVRGALVGRNILYPGDDDPLAAAEAAGGVIHRGWTVEQALEARAASRGCALDWISRYAA